MAMLRFRRVSALRALIDRFDLFPIVVVPARFKIASHLRTVCRTISIFGGDDMRTWKTPKVVEIAVGMEINSYACARV